MSSEFEWAASLALDHAASLGMQQAEVSLHQGTGIAVTARQQELETVEKNNDKQIIVNVYQAHKTGSASSADFSEKGIRDTVAAAASIASFTGADDCLGLADANSMARQEIDLDLYHPWIDDVSELAELALQCESAALEFSDKISNSEGASVNTYQGTAAYANSHGFYSQRQGTRHSISCSVIGETASGMQRDYWYDSNRDANKLASAVEIGEIAAERTLKRLDSRKIPSTQASILYDPSMAKSLIGHLVGAIKGGVIYKKASFLVDKLEQQVMPSFMSISEHPHLLGGASSAWHDAEGVATPEIRNIVDDGILQSYVLGSYTARKLGMQTTANAGGVRNIAVSNTGQSHEQLIKQMDRGLLVTELIGSGINLVTGDYSRGAAGFWVEGGEIQFPVEEITIAGNLIEMFKNIIALGTDIDPRGNIAMGSVLVEEMTIAGD